MKTITLTPLRPARHPAAWAWLLVLLLGLGLAARAQTVPPRPSPPRLVNDLAGLLQPQEVAALEQKLVAYNDSTSSQIAVVTVPSLDGNDIADYAQKLYEGWGIGQKGKDNGILVLVAAKEHTARIQTGYGLEGAVPDALAKRIISNVLVPAFKQNQYYAGLDRATDALISLARGEGYKGDPNAARRGPRDRPGSGIGMWLIIGALVLFFILRSRGGGGGRGGRGGGGFIPPIIFGDFSGGRGVFGGGGGGFGGGGGGGFGGFGGGSSGGGGASGSW
ncbi:TPM domain-containing protein [Hymenobacter sp. H14-R3]|uniref:TPM domain-containing protein n=1 Tax=Hymenobacter sp. H14-R3 TaxID=3046308 RepID=UPI0024BA3D8D|nr:TPM domain-containing protein [Hymenobacter sp. H14-R3]MDJ0364418.1 TPM domain-containing protein [Hymenobacter sp. H14-R3]